VGNYKGRGTTLYIRLDVQPTGRDHDFALSARPIRPTLTQERHLLRIKSERLRAWSGRLDLRCSSAAGPELADNALQQL
jgi:hypothetical protein